MATLNNRPTSAFIAASWCALIVGAIAYCIGLFNAQLLLNEKGLYLVLLLYGLFSVVSLQKVVRDRLDGLEVTHIYFALCWVSVGICITLLLISLFNATMNLSEKGFYIMAYLMSMFGAIATQKNVRDMEYLRQHSLENKTQLQQQHPYDDEK